MNVEKTAGLERRASLHAALGDTGRLRIVDALAFGDASPSELADALEMPSNLLAHHLNVLESRGLVGRTRSEGDRRRSYVRLAREVLAELTPETSRIVPRVLFVCTANTARSHLAAALWRRVSSVPVASAGTHPATHIDPRAMTTAGRYQLRIRRVAPQAIEQVFQPGDLIITVCDLAHEELRTRGAMHWSIPDPVRVGTDVAFDRALETLAQRVDDLAPTLVNG